MNIFDFLFGWGGQAIQLIFRYGFIPKEEDFLELTNEQYLEFHIKEGECNDKIFMLAQLILKKRWRRTLRKYRLSLNPK